MQEKEDATGFGQQNAPSLGICFVRSPTWGSAKATIRLRPRLDSLEVTWPGGIDFGLVSFKPSIPDGDILWLQVAESLSIRNLFLEL